jgi:hypothetical protein
MRYISLFCLVTYVQILHTVLHRYFRIFQKNGITEFFYILLIVSFSSK